MRIGLYGGSFNPVHYGHVNVAKTAIKDLRLDRLIIIPANISPFKTETPTIFNRVEMVRNAFEEFAEIDLREINRGGISYAIDTVKEIATENRGAELFFIIGEDSIDGLLRWKNIDELKQLCTFKSYPRTKESSTEIRMLFEQRKVRYNSDTKVVEVVKSGLKRKAGFCPCRLPKLPEFFCPCDEFKEQLRDPSFSGLCHCRYYEADSNDQQPLSPQSNI